MNRRQFQARKTNPEHISQDKTRSSHRSQPLNTNYQEMTKSQLIKQLQNRDKRIEELEDQAKNQSKADKEKLSMYRDKLEQEIAHNQKAVKSFESITQTVVDIINKYQYLDQQTRQTVANVVEGIRETCGKGKQQSDSEDEEGREQKSQFSCIEEIVTETAKLLQYLSKLTDENVAFVIRLRAELARSKTINQKIHLPLPKKESNEELRLQREEINRLVVQNQNLNKLLEQNEVQKHKLLTSINATLTQKMIEQLSKQTVINLIQQIKRLSYRTRELEKDKEQIFKKTRAEKEMNQKKFQQLLKEVKQIRVKKRGAIEIH